MATKTTSLEKKLETLKKGLTNKFISATQKEKIKSQVEKIEQQIKSSKPAKKTISSSLSKLQKLVNKKKYGVYKGAGVDLKKDGERPAKPIGKRKSASGNTYYEYRANRIDVKQPSKKATYPKLAKGGSINMDRHIWEGWTVGNFIEELNIEFRYHPKFKSRDEVKKWAMENQPYYKKYIPEVVDYYWEKNQEKYEKGGYMAKGGVVATYHIIPFKKYNDSSNFIDALYSLAFKVDGTLDEAIKIAQEYVIVNELYAASITKMHPSGQALKNKKVAFVTKDNVEKYEEGGYMAKGGQLEVGDMVMVDDSGNTKLFSGFNTSEPAKIISKDKKKVFGKVKYFYGLEMADGRKPFNNAEESMLTKVSKYGGYMAKGGDLENWKAPKEIYSGKDIQITIPKMGKFDEQKVVAVYDKDNFIFKIYDKDKKRVLTKMGGSNFESNLMNGSYKMDGYMAKGGMLMHGFQNGDKVIEIYKGQGIVDNGGVIVVVNPDYGTRFIIDLDESKPTGKKSMNMSMDDQIKSAKEYIDWWSSNGGETPDTLDSVFDKYGSYEDGGYMAKGGDISVYNLRKGDKVKTRKGDIETIIRKTGSGSYETIESEYTHSPESLEFVSRPGRKMADGGEVGENGYVAFYKGKRIEVYAKTPYEAQLKAAKVFGAKKSYDVNVVLAEVGGKQVVHNASFEQGGYMADGGVTEKEVVESNAQMVLSQIKAVKHHADELSNVVSTKSNIEAWVVGKIERASTDLSDITHYLEGRHEKMSMGGSIRYYTHKMDK